MNNLDLPSGVGDKTVSMFANASSTKPADGKLKPLLEAIRNGQYERQINRLRNLLKDGKKEEYDRDKKNLPAVTISGKFSKRNANGLLDHSGIMQIDIDKVENPAELRDKLIQDKHICAAFISPSGKGVKALILITADHTKHKAAFIAAENHLQAYYDVQIDKSCKDVGRLCFVSYDADLRTNTDAIPLPLPEEPSKITPQRKSFPKQSESETADRLRSALQVLSAEDYETWIKYGMALRSWNGPGAFEIWHSWSKTASNYKDHADCFNRWQSFDPSSGIDESAIFRAATDAGWNLPSENTNPETLNISLADSGLEERQKKSLKSQATQKAVLLVVRASDVKTKPIKWIWTGILAQGKLVFLAGDAGLGKSQVSLFICAIISRGGQWPVTGETCEKGSILILSAEDGADDTIVPRLQAVNADLENIHIIQAVKLSDGQEKIFDLTSDVEQLKDEAVRIGNVKMIIIDPISAYLGKIDSHRNTEVRDALNPIIKFADDIGACLLCVTHLNKGGSGNALSRVTGSIAFAAAARACFVVTRDPDDTERRLMLPLKNNLAKDTHGFAYRIDEKDVFGISTSCVAWEPDKIDSSAEEILSTQGGKSENRAFAESFLREELKDGFEIPCKGLYERAEEHGISRKVLWNMKDKIGVKANKSGFKEGWVWYLPIATDNEDPQNSKIPEDSLIQNGNLGEILAKKESSQEIFTETI
jgi:putative DNA primase/helicase